jgi:hypothetical protein
MRELSMLALVAPMLLSGCQVIGYAALEGLPEDALTCQGVERAECRAVAAGALRAALRMGSRIVSITVHPGGRAEFIDAAGGRGEYFTDKYGVVPSPS